MPPAKIPMDNEMNAESVDGYAWRLEVRAAYLQTPAGQSLLKNMTLAKLLGDAQTTRCKLLRRSLGFDVSH